MLASPGAVPASVPRSPGLLRQIVVVAGKDLRLEWHATARIQAVVCFAALSLFLFSFAVGPQQQLLARVAPGFLWLALLLASILRLGESMRQELDTAALEGQLLLGAEPMALFLGKALANVAFLFGLAQLLLPVAIALYDAPLQLGWLRLTGALALGTAAIAAPGTLYAALSSYAKARDLLLPLLLFPILIPGLLAAVKATSAIMLGDPMNECGSWLALLVAFNALYWTLCTALFGRVVQP
jgi:heme exporter protein B